MLDVTIGPVLASSVAPLCDRGYLPPYLHVFLRGRVTGLNGGDDHIARVWIKLVIWDGWM